MESAKCLVLFDGVCNLCNNTVRFIFKRDKKDRFRYLSLQDSRAKMILSSHNYVDPNLKSFVLIKGDSLYTKSTAALMVAKELGFPYAMASIFFIIPVYLRNKAYDFVAKNRYKWFGEEKTVCEFNPDFQEKMTWNK